MLFRRFHHRVAILLVVITVIVFMVIITRWKSSKPSRIRIIQQDGHYYLLRHDNKEKSDEAHGQSRLDHLITLIDTDGNKHLTKEEIEEWVFTNTKEHLEEGEKQILNDFRDVDIDQSGYVSWDEFFIWHQRNLQHESGDKSNNELKEEWNLADSDANKVLDKNEFLCFRHPELCERTIRQLTAEVLKNLDSNKDGWLSKDEYAVSAPGQVEKGFEEIEENYLEQRRKEFAKIDTSGDGKVTEEELRVFLNPKNHIHAKTEAEELVVAADDNGDGMLSIGEISRHSNLFEQSKVMNLDQNFHHDF